MNRRFPGLPCPTFFQSGKPTGISDGLDFVDIKVVDDGIKAGVEVIEEVHHLEGSAVPGNLGEANNVTIIRERE